MFLRGSLLLALLACGKGEPSDEDLIEKLVADVTGEVDSGYADRALAYTEVARYSIDVRVPHHAGVYDARQAPEIFAAFRRGIREQFEGDTFKLRGLNIEIAGDSAEVAFGIVTHVGLLKVGMTVRKPEPGVWKITRVHVDR